MTLRDWWHIRKVRRSVHAKTVKHASQDPAYYRAVVWAYRHTHGIPQLPGAHPHEPHPDPAEVDAAHAWYKRLHGATL